MIQKTVKITHHDGIHIRPATELAKLSGGFASSITIHANGETADAKSALEIMTLAADTGQEVVVTAEGPDEETAMSAVERFFADGKQ